MDYIKRLGVVMVAIVFTLTSFLPTYAQDPLTQTFVTLDGAFELDYPTGWDVFDEGGVIPIGNVPGVVDKDIEDLVSGEMGGLVVTPAAIEDFLQLSPDDTPQAGADAFGFDENGNLRQQQRVTLDANRTGIRIDLSDNVSDGFGLFFETLGGGLAVLIAFTVSSEMDDFEPTLIDMATHFRRTGFEPPATNQRPPVATVADLDLNNLPPLGQSFTTTNNELTIQYPPTWQAFQDNVIVILSPNGVTSGEVPSGEVSIYIRIPEILGYTGVVNAASSYKGLVLQWGLLFRFVYSDLEANNFSSESFSVNGREMYMLTYASFFGDIALVGFELSDGSDVMAYAISAPGEMGQQLPYILAIAASLELA